MKVPRNIIVENKYTSGGEFVIEGTHTPYKGYYVLVNGAAYTGKELTDKSIKLAKSRGIVIDTLLKIGEEVISSFIFDVSASSENNITRYFVKKTNENPVKIFEVDKDNYDQSQRNPGYQTTSINWSKISNNNTEIDTADMKFPGLKAFLKA